MVVGDIVRCWRGVGICYRRQHPWDWLACRHSLGFCGCLRRDSRLKKGRADRQPEGPRKVQRDRETTEHQSRNPTERERRWKEKKDCRRAGLRTSGPNRFVSSQAAVCHPPGRGRLGRDPATSKLQSAIPPTAAGEADTRAMGLPALRSGQSPQGAACHRSCRSTKGGLSHFAPSATTSVPVESMHCSMQTLKLFNPSQAFLLLH